MAQGVSGEAEWEQGQGVQGRAAEGTASTVSVPRLKGPLSCSAAPTGKQPSQGHAKVLHTQPAWNSSLGSQARLQTPVGPTP